MPQSRDLRIHILLSIPVIWLVFFILTDYYRTSYDENPGQDRHWDISNLKILPQNAPQAQTLQAVFELKKIPINRAGKELLATIPGIGPELARRIVEQRTILGHYRTPEDLTRVPGIGPRRLEQFKPHLSFD